MKLFPGGREHPGVLAMVQGSPPLSPRNIVLCVCALAEGGAREMMEGWSAHCQNVGLRGHQYDQLHLIWLKGPRVLEGGELGNQRYVFKPVLGIRQMAEEDLCVSSFHFILLDCDQA